MDVIADDAHLALGWLTTHHVHDTRSGAPRAAATSLARMQPAWNTLHSDTVVQRSKISTILCWNRPHLHATASLTALSVAYDVA